MPFLKTLARISFVVVSASVCRADVSKIRTFLESTLSEQDESRVPNPDEIIGQSGEDAIRSASVSEIQSLLPLGQKCLHSPKLLVRGAGLLLFLGVDVARLDSSSLLESYVDDLASLLDDPDAGIRRGAMFILGNMNPAPVPKAMVILESRLNDKNIDAEAALGIASILLKTGNAATVPNVLAVLDRWPEHRTQVIQMLGVYRITTEGALKLIHSGFQDPRPDGRRVAVDAVESLPKDLRKGFEQDLLHLMQNPDEDPQISQRARQVYLQ